MIDNQAYLFLIFLIDGVLIGGVFDFFRILRRSFKTKDCITYLEDILFWIFTGGIILYSIFIFNNGEIRLFIFFGIILGVLIYMFTISKYILKISVYVITGLKKIIYIILKKTILPLKKCIYDRILKNIKLNLKNKIKNQ